MARAGISRLRQKTKRTLNQSGFIVGVVRAVRGGVMDLKRLRWFVLRRGQIQAYLRANSIRKLQIGAGQTPLSGWLNTDVLPQIDDLVYLDATRRFPFADNVFDYVACEHMIEHIDYPSAVAMLRESLRVLKPGGKIRVATPNLRVLVGLCADEITEMQKHYTDWITAHCVPDVTDCKTVFVINNAFRAWGHQFIYDPETLMRTLAKCGFVNLKIYSSGISEEQHLRGIEGHGKITGDETINDFETFVIEGSVPEQKRMPEK
jgi:predicted SAM-dependent methyltransferase